MTRAVPIVLAIALMGQATDSTARNLLNAARPLTPGQIATVLIAVRATLAGRTIRLAFAPDGPGPDVLFDAEGRAHIIRTVDGVTGGIVGGDGSHSTYQTTTERIAVYTGTPAHRCDGTTPGGELVIEYRNDNHTGWKATARARSDHEVLAPALAMLFPSDGMESGGRETLGERHARAIVAPWTPPPSTISFDAFGGDPLPNVEARAGATPPRGSETLWIDVDSLRPLRWSVSVPGTRAYTLIFTYDLSPEPEIPAGVTAPACVQ